MKIRDFNKLDLSNRVVVGFISKQNHCLKSGRYGKMGLIFVFEDTIYNLQYSYRYHHHHYQCRLVVVTWFSGSGTQSASAACRRFVPRGALLFIRRSAVRCPLAVGRLQVRWRFPDSWAATTATVWWICPPAGRRRTFRHVTDPAGTGGALRGLCNLSSISNRDSNRLIIALYSKQHTHLGLSDSLR